mgnify:CR=1 FL=1
MPLNDRASILAADAQRALDGLSSSLSKGSQGMAQGALHSRDLAVALTQVGLDPVSSIVDDVARQLTLGQPSVLEMAASILPMIEKALADVRLGHVPDAESLQEDWMPWTRKLQETIVRDARPLQEFQAVVPKIQEIQLQTQAQAPTSPEIISDPETAILNSNDPGVMAIRIQGLRLIQQARIVNQQDDERSVRQMDALLSELQDWSLRLGQCALSNIYPRFRDAMKDVWVDAQQLESLESVMAYASKATQMIAQSRSLTIFLDWHGMDLTELELQTLAKLMRDMRGQVRKMEGGYRLVFPCSLARMRVIPFMLKGQRYAVGAAQYVQFEPMTVENEGAGKILLRSGNVTKSLAVDRVFAAENVNISPIPDVIERPQWLAGVTVDNFGEVYLCVAPV